MRHQELKQDRTYRAGAIVPIACVAVDGCVLSARKILLANSKARQIRTYDGAANGLITRAKAEVLVFSRPTPANQSATRSRLIAAAVARCWRCVFDLPIYLDLLILKARTPCEIVPSIPA